MEQCKQPTANFLVQLTHNGTLVTVKITKSYGLIEATDLWTQCEKFLTRADVCHQANQKKQMMKGRIWDLLTVRAHQSLAQYKSEYTFIGVICGPFLLKIIIRLATMDSRATISIIHAQLSKIDTYAAGVVGDVEKITEFFTNNLDRLKASGANLNDEVDTLFKV